MTTFDWIVLGGYLALLVGIGSWQRKRASGSAEDFFASGRRLPWYLAGTSMIAASFASDTPLFVSGLVREHGIWRNWLWWGNAISLILTVFFFSRLWRRSRVLTEVEITEVRYGGRSAAVLRGFKAVYWGLLFNAFATGAWSVTGLRKVFQSTLEMDPTAAVVRAIGRKELRDAIVRVHIKLHSTLAGAIREPDIRRALEHAGTHTVAAISREVAREARTRMGAVQVAGKSPMQLLEYYLEAQKVPPERAQQLLQRARRLMAEDEREEGSH